MEMVGGTHFTIFAQNLKFSFPPKLEWTRGNEIRFNEIFTKSPIMSLVFCYNPILTLYIQPIFLNIHYYFSSISRTQGDSFNFFCIFIKNYDL